MKKCIALGLLLTFSSAVYAEGLVLPKEISTQSTPQIEPAKPLELAAPVQQEVLKAKAEIVKIPDRDFDRYITIQKQTQPLTSKLNDVYTGYKVTITSNYPRPLAIRTANVTNAVDGQSAARVVHDNPWKSLLWFLVPYVGVILLPVMAISYNSGNSKAKKEGLKYPGQIPTATLKKGEPLQFMVITSAGQTPAMILKLADAETDQEFIYNAI